MTDIGKADRPKGLSVEQRVVDGIRVVTMQGEIGHDVEDVLGEALLGADGAVPPPRIVADLGGVTFMDSSGINVFLAAHRQVSGARGWLRIAAAQEPVLQVLRPVGVDALLSCHATTEQALNP
ncbi:STAS domain-containing protein [Streptomyces sp. NBC_00015]|uniref:STAS domain-containing protein n=1 Tax=Streptomyces sp. NBC_00015 TaxID=2903611 RepID=UPI00324AB1BB